MSAFRQKFQGLSVVWPTKVSRLVFICMKRQALPDKRLPEWEEICATAAAAQNFHLMAAALGLGAFWSSHTWCREARDSKEMRQRMGLDDEEDRVFGCFTLGRYDQSRKFKSARSAVSAKVKYVE